MQLFFDHICGQQSDKDFIHCLVSATFEESEYDWAFENGWCPSNIWYNNDTNFCKNNNLIWYQSRQVRLDLSKYKENKKERKARKNSRSYYFTKSPNFEELYSIYDKYVEYKQFEDRLDFNGFLDSYKDDSLVFIIYEDVAFSVLEKIGKHLIAHQFCWDYSNPREYLGKFAGYVEIEYAIKNGFSYIYLGPSYEKGSIYKKDFEGFEFWTGRKWCDDKRLYIKQLEKDEIKNSTEEICGSYDEFFSDFSV